MKFTKRLFAGLVMLATLLLALVFSSAVHADTMDRTPAAAVLQLDSHDTSAEVSKPAAPLLATAEPRWIIVSAIGLGLLCLTVRGRSRKAVGIAAVLAAIAFSCTPAFAEVKTKGGALMLRPLPRETANFAYTNDVAQPGLPALVRVSSWNGTNHLIVTTNAQLGFVAKGTNYLGYTGGVNLTNSAGAGWLYFVNGLLVASNHIQAPTLPN